MSPSLWHLYTLSWCRQEVDVATQLLRGAINDMAYECSEAAAALTLKLRSFVTDREASEEAFVQERTVALAAVFAERFQPLDAAVAERLDAVRQVPTVVSLRLF